MSDNWDDDDFGTFESADVNELKSSTSSSLNKPTHLPAWLLEAQTSSTPPTSAIHESTGAAVAKHLEKSPGKVEETDALASKSVISLPGADKTEDESKHSSVVPEYAFGDIFSNASTQPKPINTRSELMEEQRSEQEINEELQWKQEKSDEKMKKEKHRRDNKEKERNLVLELNNQLDSAIALKQESEKTLKEVQEKLDATVKELNDEMQRKEAQHRIDLQQLEEKRKKDIKLQREDSENTMKELTEQYTTLCKQVADEQKLQFEKHLLEITEKCCVMLGQQNESMTQLLIQQNSMFDDKLSDSLARCRSDLGHFLEDQMKMVEEKCSRATEDVVAAAKVQIDKELSKELEINAKSKQDLVEELTRTHKEQIRASLGEERERTDIIIKNTIEETRESVSRIARQERQELELSRERHLGALSILLTSSQEHLRHLRDDVTSNLAPTNGKPT
uniref:Uncharacterized protein n=1 Tax=Ciona savignyi TaxID=51511 RepID=H2Z319_CIOSA